MMMNHQILQRSHNFPSLPLFPRSVPRHLRNLIPFPGLSYASKHYNKYPLQRRLSLLCASQNANSEVVIDSRKEEREMELEEAAILMSTCITRTLPAALTLEEGLNRIEEAIQFLMAKPPSSSSGMFRFQVAVPPSAKALNWFCSQPESDGVFPQFYLSKEKENPTYKSLALGRTRGVFGIGSALSFNARYTNGSENGDATSEGHLSVELTFPRVYGFLDTNVDKILASIEHETGSFYLFIPQIELDEFEDTSILAATLAWNDSSLCTFYEAIQTYELSLFQARINFLSTTQECSRNCISSTVQKFNIMEDKSIQMVRLNAVRLRGNFLQSGSEELASDLFCQFSARFSPTLAVANNMIDRFNLTSYYENDCPNINTLWASLIIEECVRLGVTYFCIAPGSRSSPLTLAASAHPLTTCVVCIDERSLAFNALGYARGSHRPAVVITTSGTAVSNLLSAVVEASEDFVPLILLTADRPPELLDAGANQAINQVNHFGQFTKHFFGLPVPTDDISSRMVLTTLDSAVYMATTSPYGPVHINCPFREPLGNIQTTWESRGLKGLENWMSTSEPFTTYSQVQHSVSSNQCHGLMAELVKLIQGAKQGLLVLGALHTEDDIWAALLLAKHLNWPVVAGILSGLRLRKYMASFSEIEENIIFLDHLDQMLLSGAVNDWMQADVIIQIGGRLVSKRISKMLEGCFPCSYIMVDKHPKRHDPSHIVTHRIQSTIMEFTVCVTKACIPHDNTRWKAFLRVLNSMAAREISSLIDLEQSLTEPYIAHVALENLRCNSAIFIGNSMAIRDADMYGYNWAKCTHETSEMLSSGFQCHRIQVAGNRGTGGIDGLLSTAVGFGVGCNKHVLCLIGDVSFLYDTNGLSLLRQGVLRKPMIVIVINNQGGAIFSLLPYAKLTDHKILDQFFYTSHDVAIGDLCMAHGMKHAQVQTKKELGEALLTAQQENCDHVIEVKSCIDNTATFHSHLGASISQAIDHSLGVLSKLSQSETTLHGSSSIRISKMEYSLYRIPLRAPPTSSSGNNNSSIFYREGFVISLCLEGGGTGFGEVAPLEIHRENLLEVEEQLRFLIHVIEGRESTYFLSLLNGSISSWIWNCLGISPDSLFPSVRCGLEMAILNAIAASKSSSLIDIFHPRTGELHTKGTAVKICGLIDSIGGPTDMASAASALVEEGFAAIKIKVARRSNPIEDAMVIQEVRRKVGNHVEIRVDANRGWTFSEAAEFANLVKNCNLQYIEEPVKDEDDIVKFCEETNLPVALDETVNNTRANPLEVINNYTHSGIVAVVIKPSMLGGFENAALVAQWAQKQGKMAIVSATFESGLGLSAYTQFSSYLNLQNAEIRRLMKKERSLCLAHGLGTYKWLKEDLSVKPAEVHFNSNNGFVGASVVDTAQFLQRFQVNQNVIVRTFDEEQVRNYQLPVDFEGVSYSINVLETGKRVGDYVFVFLHGFLGRGEDWIPIMKAFSRSVRCIAIDLPGHARSDVKYQADNGSMKRHSLSVDAIAGMLCKFITNVTSEKVILVGYSMGARIALHMALKYDDKIDGAVIISGSPGLTDPGARKFRRAKDDFRASSLVSHGLEHFLGAWYVEEIWNSLRSHPHFSEIVTDRLQHDDLHTLAKVLSDSSIGRQQPLWEDLKQCNLPLLLIVGEDDAKFKQIAKRMLHKISHSTRMKATPAIVEVPKSGHAAHLENPLHVIYSLRQFLNRVKTLSSLQTQNAVVDSHRDIPRQVSKTM
ncbi:protein PHYLLO, chloroplastic-like isoform X2 [Coffea arabica]|uniref:Protein PHYLLO, chloroplastic-like isoform X2 n=1 Tax=Coffea arabica TaxID=13443 RepID=A0ABM4W553_COFAR